MLFTIQIEANSLGEALQQLRQEQTLPTAAPGSTPTQAVMQTATASVVPLFGGTAGQQPDPPGAAPTVPVSAKVYTEDELMRAAAALMDAGKMADIQQILVGMGVQTFTQLPQERYGEFAMALKGLGAKL